MGQHLILYTDEEGDPHVRAISGSIADAERALELIQATYETYNPIQLIDDVVFVPLAAIEEECRDVSA